MVDAQWSELEGTELEYGGDGWELTSEVDVRNTGTLREVEARRVDGVCKRAASLRFELAGDERSPSVNAGNVSGGFHRLERHRQYLVVSDPQRTYRSGLRGIVHR
ncbi:hypothetical protein [Halobiforma nitratireducens]|uniref:Uncharacterized protein n=1 Tax=Halobiforma nitratireducens JCM 10879 TaxID=1227454 RepID=M0LYC6_9EURY|nr:hypothetical protein [Halobiforma nitratireducens]EMA37359.1 hypothetical protein C446_10910 [Halobiforma nitratireducens JCM 10879]